MNESHGKRCLPSTPVHTDRLDEENIAPKVKQGLVNRPSRCLSMAIMIAPTVAFAMAKNRLIIKNAQDSL
jgi:hypothetical protein